MALHPCKPGVPIVLGVLLFAGCWRARPAPAPPIVMISLSFPGFSARELDAGVCGSLCESLAPVVGVKGITCVSSEGHAAIYVEARPGIVGDNEFLVSLRDRVQQIMPRLPANMTIAAPQQVPAVPDLTDLPIREEFRLRVLVDRERAARYGIAAVEVEKLAAAHLEKLAAAHRDADPVEMGDLLIRTTDGQEVPLRQLARLEMVAEPNYVVRRFGDTSSSEKDESPGKQGPEP